MSMVYPGNIRYMYATKSWPARSTPMGELAYFPAAPNLDQAEELDAARNI